MEENIPQEINVVKVGKTADLNGCASGGTTISEWLGTQLNALS